MKRLIKKFKKIKQGGVYEIRSIQNGKRYIGSSVNVGRRILEGHLEALEKQKHGNDHLQKHFNKYDREDLKFYLLEIVPRKIKEPAHQFREKIINREQYWLDKLNPEFNICKIAGSTLGTKRSKQAIEKTTGKNNGMYGVTGKLHPSYGITRPDSVKEAVSKANTGRKKSKQSLLQQSKNLKKFYTTKEGDKLKAKKSEQYSGEGNPFYGKTHSKETKRKIANTRLGTKTSEETKKKMSEAHKKRYEGEAGRLLKAQISKSGKETRRKIREARVRDA